MVLLSLVDLVEGTPVRRDVVWAPTPAPVAPAPAGLTSVQLAFAIMGPVVAVGGILFTFLYLGWWRRMDNAARDKRWRVEDERHEAEFHGAASPSASATAAIAPPPAAVLAAGPATEEV
jgi:H+/gluconate symporter-like permease